ncbi:MAG: SDR family NAD(P)-dependent oxidoreductase [Myxococcota bacterium]
MKTLQGKVAVITGAASGIGAALSAALAQRGCRLALVDIQAERLADTAKTARGLGATVSTHVIDVSNRAAMATLPEAVIEAHGAAHLIVNNAGVTVIEKMIDHSLEDWDWILGINLYGVIYGCHFFLPRLLEAGEGHIVNISSVFGIAGVPTQSSYCATKFAVRGLSESLWEELDGTGVSVTVVHPGGINTDIVVGSRTRNTSRQETLAGLFRTRGRSASAAADMIVRAVERDQKRVLIGPEAYVIDGLRRLMPAWGNRLITQGAIGWLVGRD